MRARRPAPPESEHRPTEFPFIRRHRRNASARIPCRNASAHNLDRNAFARSRDPHDVWAHCRLVQKPRGTDR